jgi:hypothetical protein
MRVRYIEALEHEAWVDLPGRTYARAFLRTYAAALGLEAERFVAEFDDQWPEPVEPIAVAHRRERRVARPPVLAAAVAVAIGLIAWSEWPHGGGLPPSASNLPSAKAATKPVAHVRGAHHTRRRAPARLVVRAVGGPCWLEARRGGPYGGVLAERTLLPGESVSFAAPHVWLRLGAPWNVVVRRGAHVARGLPVGQPADVTL